MKPLPNPVAGMSPGERHPVLSVVVPCFNEADGLPHFHARLVGIMRVIGEPWEVVYVNDGSRDATLGVLLAMHRSADNIAVVNLSRNFGKEIALTAGLDHARGDAVIVIDADLQDPPEVIPELVAGWHEGFDTVYAKRRDRIGETWLKKATAKLFYRLMQRLGGAPMPQDVGDFRLISRRALDALLQLRERHRFMKGLFAWIGFSSKAVIYDRAPRHLGSTSWSYWRLWNFALEGITSHTLLPLRLASYLGLVVAALAIVYIVEIVIRTLLFGNPVAGYPSLMAAVLFFGGVQLLTLGTIGEYLGRIFNETKYRPLYFTERVLSPTGMEQSDPVAEGNSVQEPQSTA